MRCVFSARVWRGLVGLALVFVPFRAQAATFTLSPTSVSFGNQVVDTTSAPKTVTLTNTGPGALTFDLSIANAEFAATSACGGTVTAGGTCVLSITFRPSATGNRAGTLVVTDSTSGANTLSAPLAGSGVLATTVSPTTVSFGNVVQNTPSAKKKVKLVNNLSVPLTGITFTSSHPDFVVSGCPATLKPLGKCTAAVVFTPTAAPGTLETATLTLTHSGATSPETVSLSGTSVLPLSLSAGTLTFAATPQGGTTVQTSLKLRNNLKTAISSIVLTASAPFSASGCPPPLKGGKTCTITATFAPTSQLGTVTGTLSASSADPAAWNTATAALQGTAVKALSITPDPLDMGSVTVAATGASKKLTIKNNLKTSITFAATPFTFTGADAGDFAVASTTCGASLAAGAGCTINVTLTPTRGGPRSANFTVNSSASGSPHTAAVTGVGTTPVTISPAKISFGNVGVGLVSAGKLVTLQNNQDIPAAINAVIPSSPEFAKEDTATTSTTCGATIPAGGSCVLSLVMKPTVGGLRTGKFTIVTDTSEPQLYVDVSGSAIDAVTASVSTLKFGIQKIQTTSISKQVILTNHQTVPATLGLSVTGDFAATSSCGATIPAQSTCAVSVTFTPLTAAALNGLLTFSNPGGPDGKVTLSGTGSTQDPPASIVSVSPGAGTVGGTVTNVVVTGSYTTFTNGAPIVSFGGGVTPSAISVVSDTQLVIGSLAIASDATPGARTVQVTNGTITASLAAGFVVSASPGLSFSSITPSVASQGETLNIAVVGSNTHFAPGVTTANFGDGVFVNGDVAVQDATHASVNVTVSPTATLGWRAVTFVTGGEYATLLPTGASGPGFQVVASEASLTSVTPGSGVQGDTPFVVTIVGSGTHFLQGASTVSFGPGINVGSTVVDSPTQLHATIAVQAAAATGARTVTVTTGGEVAARASAFTVTPSSTIPYLSGVSPTAGRQGDTLTITLTGVNTHFTTATPAPSLEIGSNIAVDSLVVLSDTTVQATLSISLQAVVGGRSGILSAGGSNFNFTFTVLPSVASIVGVSPASVPQGHAVSIHVTGANTHWDQSTTAAWFLGTGCPVASVDRITIESATSALLDLTVPANACVGTESFQMATGGEVVTGGLGVYRQTPSLGLSPSSGMVGRTITVNFVGEFSHFAPAGSAQPTTAVIDGTGVEIVDFTVNSPTSATARFVIAPDAPSGSCTSLSPGCHTVTVTSPLASGSEILTASFQVTSTPAVLVSIESFHAAPGASALVRIRGSYTHFLSGVTTVGFGPGITTSLPSVISETELTVNISIDATAAIGWRSAYVNTGGEQLTIGFRVDGPASPIIAAVSPASGAQGQSLTVTITGANTNFSDSSVLILGAGVTVADFAVTSPTTATAVIAVSATAPVGPNTVVVMTPTSDGDEIASGAGFSVTRGPSQILSVTPNVATQSQILNVALVGQGTHWLQGGSVADFGPGVVVNSLAVADATHATAQITILSTAALGFRTVAMQTDGEYVALVQGLNIQDASPALLSSAPNAGQQGTTFNVQVLARHTHWQQGVTTASYGAGITVNSFTVVDSVSGVANVTVDPLAFVDVGGSCHGLTVTTGTEQVTLASQLCVQAGAAVVTDVNPGGAGQGQTLTVTVTGQNTHFTAGLTTADFGAGINVSNVTVTSPTSAQVDLAVTSSAANGYRTATLRTLGETASKSLAFVVGAGQPTLNQAAPNSGQQGEALTVRLIGQFTHWTQGTTTATFGQGITVSGVTVVNATTADVSLSISPLAFPGSRSVTVTTGGEIVSGSFFTVTRGPAQISDVAPTSGNQGQEIRLTITGLQTHWSQGATQFSMSGLGQDIRLDYFLVQSPTSAVAGVTISPTASLGARSIYMVTAGESLVHANAFVVTGGIPAIASVSPGSGKPGVTNLNVQIAGLYTKWDATTTVDFGPGITVQTFTVNNNTSITAVLAIDVAAGLGPRTVTVRTGTQVLTGFFQVVSPTPPTPYISYMSPSSGLAGQTFTVTFTGQYTSWHPVDSTINFGDPGTSGITINSFQVTSSTTARANITIAGGAAVGPRTVQIETGTEIEEATFSVVVATPAINIVDASSGMQGATLDVNVLGQYTTFDATTTFSFGAGVTVNSATVLGPTVATVNLSVDQLAVLGFRGVTATTGAEVVQSLSGVGFSVTPSQAVVKSVTPNTARQRDTLTVTVIGENTHWDGTTTFSFGSGIGVSGTTIDSATSATVDITLADLAALGARTVTATTAGEVASLANAFIVQPGTPLILSSAPASGQQQSNVTFTILGQFTEWVDGTTTVSLGNGVTVTSASVTSPTAITATAAVEWWAMPGYRTLTVTTGSEVLTLPFAFVVTSGPAAVSGLSPASGGQGATLNVVVTGVNTHFTAGVTTAAFGPGISVNSVSVTNATSATVNITIAGNATPGQNSVALTTQGETAGASAAFTVILTTPTIQFVSPSSAAQGSTGTVSVIGSLTNFTAATTFDFGPDVVVNSTSIVSATEATVNITVSPLAARTTRTVTATTGTVTATGTNLFTVTAGPAYISAVSPNTGRQNQTGLQVTISGNQTHFTAGTPTVNLGSGVSVTSQSVTSDTLMTVTVNIAPSAPVQMNGVSVTTLGEVATLAGGFTVQAGQPILTAASPVAARQNETLDVVITGLYTHFGASTTASFGSGITVNGIVVNGSTQATVNISIDPAAAVGSRTVTLTTGSESATGVGVFSVQAGAAQLVSVSPNTGPQGSTQTVTVTGLYTHFQGGVSTVSFSGGGLTTGSVTVNGPTQLQVPVTVTLGATAGPRTVTVTTGSEVVVLTNAFTVLPGLPAITIINPNVGVPNSTVNVTITGEFTNFVPGTTQASFGAEISVNGAAAGGLGPVTVTSATSATATLQIASGAALGPRNVTVQTGTEVLNVNNGFTVQSATPTAPTVTRIYPIHNMADVPTNTAVTVEFSAPIDRTTVTTANVRLTDVTTQYYCWNDYSKTTPATVQVDASGRIATLLPSTVLAVGRMYSVCVNYGQQGTASGITDPAGNAVTGTYSYFTTGFGPDTTGPAFVAANIDGATPVGINVPLVLGFTTPINPATVQQGLTVTTGGSAVPGTFGYTADYKQVTFTPVPASPGFAPNTTYVLSYTSALEDAVGNPLSNPGSIVFTTAAGADTTTPTFTSYTPLNGSVTGLAPTLRAQFDEPLNPLRATEAYVYLWDAFSGSTILGSTVTLSADRRTLSLVPGRPLDPGTSYNWYINAYDAFGHGRFGATNFRTQGADTTAPAVVAASPADGTTGVPVNAALQVVLSEALDPTSAPTLSISPAVGTTYSTSDNVTLSFAHATLLAPGTAYTVTLSGVRDTSGNPMGDYTWSFTTGASATGDTTAGTMTQTPSSGSTGVSPSAPVIVSLSEPVNVATVTALSVRIYDATVDQWLPGSIATSANLRTITFTPSSPYVGGHVICGYIGYYASLRDLAGNAFGYLYNQCFTVGAGPDGVAPHVLAVTPNDAASGIGPYNPVTITFSEALKTSTLTSGNVALYNGSTLVTANPSVAPDGTSATFTVTLAYSTTYTVVVSTLVTDLAGNPLPSLFTSTFTTAPQPVFSRPAVVSGGFRPTSGATGVSPETSITFFVSQPLDPATVPGALFVSQNGALITGTALVTHEGRVVTFTPSTSFAAGALIQVWLTDAAADFAGNPLMEFQGSFTISTVSSSTPLTVVSYWPAYSASAPATSVAEIQFSKPVDPATLTESTFYMNTCGGTPVTAVRSLHKGNTAVRLTPAAPLTAGTCYQYFVSNAIHDTDGLPLSTGLPAGMGGGVTASFFTASSAIDSTGPAMLHAAPGNGAVSIAANALIDLTFSEPIDPITVDSSTLTLSSAGSPIPYSFATTNNADGTVRVRLTPSVALPASSAIALSMTAGVTDYSGNAATPFSIAFTTSAGTDFSRPRVVVSTVNNGDVNVAVNSVFTLTFDRPINTRSVVAGSSLYLYDQYLGTFVPITLSFSTDLLQVTASPVSLLAVNRNYYVWQCGILDLNGNSSACESFAFVTALLAPTGGPQVLLTHPVALTNVPVNVKPAIKFDRAVSRASLSGVTLTAGGVPVGYTPSFSTGDTVVTLVPQALLQPTTDYVLTVGGVKDVGGSPMSAPVVVAFRTGPTIDLVSPVMVDRTPRSNSLTGTQPVLRVRYSERLDEMRTIGGSLYEYYAGWTLPGVTFTLGADRTTLTASYPAPLRPYSLYQFCTPTVFDLAGNQLNSSCLTFLTGVGADTTAPIIMSVTPPSGAVGVPLNPTVTVRFSEPVDSTAVTSAAIALTPSAAGGVQLSADGLTLTYALAGSLAPSTAYTINLAGIQDLDGNAAAPFFSTFTTGAATDTAHGTIGLTSPAPGSSSVPVTSTIVVTLSKAVNPVSVTPDALQVWRNNSVRLAGSVAIGAGGTTLTFTPQSPLPAGATINVYAGYHVALFDLGGNSFNYLYNATFSTESVADTTAPYIMSVDPADGAEQVGPTAAVTLMFSESMDPGTLASSNIALFSGFTNLNASITRSADNRAVTLTTTLPYDSTITVVVDTGVTDISGNPIAAPFRSTFRTLPSVAADTPAITQGRPVHGATNVPVDTLVTLYASHAIDPASLDNHVVVVQNGVVVGGTLSLAAAGQAVVFTPAAPFAGGALIQVFVTTGLTDTVGTAFSTYSQSFTTAAETSANPLQVVSYFPTYSSTQPTNTIVELQFNKALDPAYATSTYFYMWNSVGTAVPATVTLVSPRVVRMQPVSELPGGTYFYFRGASGIRALDGTALAAHFDIYFNTAAGPDTTTPSVANVSPRNGAVGVGDNATIRVTFDKLIETTSINESTLTLTSGGSSLPFSLAFGTAGGVTRVTITPEAPLPDSANVTLSLTDEIIDYVGHAIAPQTVTFQTAAGPDTVRPTVVTRSVTGTPSGGVPTNTTVFRWTYSEPLDESTVGAGNHYVYPTATGVPLSGAVTISADARTVTLTLGANLASSTTYAACAGSGPIDWSGNPTIGGCVGFTTAATTAAAGPQVIATNPVPGAVGAALNPQIEIAFDKGIDATTLGGITITAGGSPVPFSWIWGTYTDLNGRAIELVPSAVLQPGTTYTVTVAGVQDLAGFGMAAPYVFSFTTGQDLMFTSGAFSSASVISGGVSTQLVNGSTITNVDTTTPIVVAFSVPVSFLSVINGGVSLTLVSSGAVVPVSVSMSADGKTATVTPQSTLAAGTQYRVQVNWSRGVLNQAGYGISGAAPSLNFTTAAF